MKMILVAVLCILFVIGCDSFHVNEDFNSIISENDPGVVFKVQSGREYKASIEPRADGEKYVTIRAEKKLRISSGEVNVMQNVKYRLSISLKNESADPVVLYSFWKDAVTESRYYVFQGRNSNPPSAATQAVSAGWTEYDEIFEIHENEKYMKIIIYSNPGSFHMKDIAICEIE